MNRTTRDLGRAVASSAGVGLLAIGVPGLLIGAVGWPLPRTVPDLGGLGRSLQAGVSDQVVVNTLAVIAWVVWVQLAVALVAEILAVVRRRPVAHLPVLPGLQGVAERLVGGMLLFATVTQPAMAFAAPAPIVAAAPPMPMAEPASWTQPVREASTAGAAAPAAELPTVTVERHDSYWAIAERTLGDGMRWREIHALNAGRTLADGSVVSVGDDTLHTGWVLLLPADAAVTEAPDGEGAAARGPGEVDASDVTVTVERGDDLWSLASARLEDELGRRPNDSEVSPYWRAVIDENRDRYVEVDNPNLVLPGQELVLPSINTAAPLTPGESAPPTPTEAVAEVGIDPFDEGPGDPPSSNAVASTTLQPAAGRDAGSPELPEMAVGAEDGQDGEWEGRLAVVASGLASVTFAVGMKLLIDRRRRRVTAEHGRPPSPTPTELRPIHQAVVANADEDRVDELQALLAAAATSLAEAGSSRRPRVVRHGPSGCEIIPDKPDVHAPDGWEASAGGDLWTCVSTPAEALVQAVDPAPLLVTLGQPEDGDQLYLDLESDAIVALTGDRAVAADLARSLIVELTLSPLADTLRVIVVGNLVGEEVGVFEHLTRVRSWAEIAADVASWANESHRSLVDNGWPSGFVARAADPDHDGLVPVAIIADTAPPVDVLEVLRAARPCAVAVVVVGECKAAIATLDCSEEAVRVVDLGLECRPQQLDIGELAEIGQLLETFDPESDEGTVEAPSAEGHPAVFSVRDRGPTSTSPGAVGGPPEFDVLVRLLGDITVEGGRPLRPKATSVVAYLAMNRAITTDRLVEACWYGTDGVAPVKRLRDTMTEVRDAFGSQHFPANRGGVYTVGPRVVTDLDLFDWHVQRASAVEVLDAIDDYRSALGLVRGPLFGYANAARASFGWVDVEHHVSTWEHRVEQVVESFTLASLQVGAARLAVDELGPVAVAFPLSTAVAASLIRCLTHDGDHRAAAAVYREHAAALAGAGLGEPDELLQQLRHGTDDL